MELSFLILCLSVLLCVQADDDTTPRDKACCDDPHSASFLNRLRPVREGELLLLHDQMTQGDTLLKERLQSRFQHVREELKEGDAQLKEQLVSGDARLKEQLQEGDARLKEEISQDEQWLKDRLTRGEDRVKEELAEGEAKMKEELEEQKDITKKLQEFVKEWTRRNDAVVAQLSEQLSDLKARLELSDASLHTAKEQLRAARAERQATQETVRNLQAEAESSREQVKEAENKIKALEAATTSLPETERDRRLHSTEILGDGFSPDLSLGSTFVRWGRTDCPDNTSLVYSGVAGGSYYNHTGGASNPLCLVMDPQLDMDLTLPKYYTFIYGGEYDGIHGHHQQDVPCSVCLAPQSSTIMVPATLTCPPGWAPHYTGYLMAGHHSDKGGTEYVCVDQEMEDVHGGHEGKNGYVFFYVVTRCGSLPCPPYVHNKAVTCVVCSV